MIPEDEDRTLLAGEYVLGVLSAEERAHLEQAARNDPELARAIHDWEERLSPLTRLVAPVPPPAGLWGRIERALPAPLHEAVTPWQRRLRRWQAAAGAGFALAAAFLLWAVLGPAERRLPSPPLAFATLTPNQGQGPALAALLQPDGVLVVASPTPLSPPPGHSYELWILPEGADKPRSLGVMPPSGRYLAKVGTAIREAAVMVSLEPEGGSPSGLPTGPVVYTGKIVVPD
jgi:anti-sigma-K factor RskA